MKTQLKDDINLHIERAETGLKILRDLVEQPDYQAAYMCERIEEHLKDLKRALKGECF